MQVSLNYGKKENSHTTPYNCCCMNNQLAKVG